MNLCEEYILGKLCFAFIVLHEQKSKLNLLQIYSVGNDSFSSGGMQADLQCTQTWH